MALIESSTMREIVKEYFDAATLLRWDRHADQDTYFAYLICRRASTVKHVVMSNRKTPDKFLDSLIKLKDLNFVRIYFMKSFYRTCDGAYILEDLASFGRLDVAHYLLSQNRTFICQKMVANICREDLIGKHPEYIGLLNQIILTGESFSPPVLSWRTNFINRLVLEWKQYPIPKVEKFKQTIEVLISLGFPANEEVYEFMS